MSNDEMSDALAVFCTVISPFTSVDDLGKLQESISCGTIDWQAVAQYANCSGMAPALHWSLDSKGLSHLIPEQFRAYLDEVYRFNRARNEELREQLLEVVLLLNGIGVTPLLLKGAAALIAELYPDHGIRFMWDLDLLIPEEQLEAAVAILMANGYSVPATYAGGPGGTGWRERHHYPPLWRTGAPAAVELHRRVLPANLDLLPPGAVWKRSWLFSSSLLPGASVALMSPTDELIHCFAHSELAHKNHYYERIDVRHLHHFACLCHRHREEFDWQQLESFKNHSGYGDVFNSYLYLAERLFRVQLPLSGRFSPEAVRHYRRITGSRHGLAAWRRLGRMLLREIDCMFSENRLRQAYQDDGPLFRLRLQHFRFLIGRYCHLEVWQRKIRSLEPF